MLVPGRKVAFGGAGRSVPRSPRPTQSRGRPTSFSSDEPERLPEPRARICKDGPRGGASFFGSTMFVGIDVSKQRLDIHVLPEGSSWSVTNDEAGHLELVKKLSEGKPELVVLEATGGYQMRAVAELAVHAIPVAV